MLSIVQIDLDSSSDNMDPIDEEFLEEAAEFIKQTLTNVTTTALDGLKMQPVVYTTRLDDMAIFNSFLPTQHPRDLTAKILKESKPKLHARPKKNPNRTDKKSFRALEVILEKMYNNSQMTTNKEPDIQSFTLEADQNRVQTKESYKFNSTTKYNDLLNLCKPLSIVLTKLELPLKHRPKVMQVERELQDRDKVEELQDVASRVPPHTSHQDPCMHRLVTNGFIEIHDLYSDEYTVYCTDYKGSIVDYYSDRPENAFKYRNIRNTGETRKYFKYCCWVQRNEHLNSLYPKALLYTNLRFMKKPHMCPVDACVCCCRKRDKSTKKNSTNSASTLPSFPFIDSSTVHREAILQEDLEIQELEDEIEQNIIEINRAPRLNTNEWLRALLTKTGTDSPVQDQTPSLIEKALSYKTPKPKRQTENRRLLKLNQEKSQPCVVVFRNFTLDERDVYELDANRELQFYVKLSCFNNTSRPDVEKLLQKPKSINDVCCWFKRESIISKLYKTKFLHSSALKFMRTRHACLGNTCNCCCKPKVIKEATLTDVPFNPKYTYSPLTTYKKPIKVYDTNVKHSVYSQSASNTKETTKEPIILRKTLMAAPRNNQSKPRPGPSNTRTHQKRKNQNTTLTDDNDCEIVAVKSPMTFRPVLPKPLPAKQANLTFVDVPNICNNDLSTEVNTTVTEILERFRDVRLTIDSNGKVAAALNMPVNTLSTVELKVLASILSYAQNQVISLGLKSEMSLSSFISRSANKIPDSEKDVDLSKTHQEFAPNKNRASTNLSPTDVDVKPLVSQTPSNSDTDNTVNTVKEEPTEANPNVADDSDIELQPKPTNLDQDFDEIIPPAKTKENVLDCFTKSTSVTNPNFNDSFASFIATQYHVQKNTFAPVITNVFSMKDYETDQVAMLSEKPANQVSNSANTTEKNTKELESTTKNTKKPGIIFPWQPGAKKRRQKKSETTNNSKKIRVLSPSQIGAHCKTEPNDNTFCNPAPNPGTMEVCGFVPGVPILTNTHFQVVSVGDPIAQQGTMGMGPISTNTQFQVVSVGDPIAQQGTIGMGPISTNTQFQVVSVGDPIAQQGTIGMGPISTNTQFKVVSVGDPIAQQGTIGMGPISTNTHYQVVSVGDHIAQKGTIGMDHAPDLSGSAKTLIVVPLNMGHMVDPAGTVNVPVSVSSTMTSAATSTEESNAPTIKAEHDDDDWILGM